MTKSTDIQQKIRTSLETAIKNNNLETVQKIFNSNGNDDIQAALEFEKFKIIAYFATTDIGDLVKDKEKFERRVKIIELIWQKANQKTRDFLYLSNIEHFQNLQKETELSDITALKTVIQEMEELDGVNDLNIKLGNAIINLDVNQVEVALENCGTDIEKVLMREVYKDDGTTDAFLIYPLKVQYSNQDGVGKIKEITKLLWDKASPDVRDFWLKHHMVNREGQNTGGNYIIDSLEEAQESFAKIPGVGEQCFQDLIKEVKDYTNDTNFWSKHKGKIALGVTGLCVAGAVAAYVLAYPAVALALAVLATVILMGAGIAKVREKVENPSVEKLFTPQQGV